MLSSNSQQNTAQWFVTAHNLLSQWVNSVMINFNTSDLSALSGVSQIINSFTVAPGWQLQALLCNYPPVPHSKLVNYPWLNSWTAQKKPLSPTDAFLVPVLLCLFQRKCQWESWWFHLCSRKCGKTSCVPNWTTFDPNRRQMSLIVFHYTCVQLHNRP